MKMIAMGFIKICVHYIKFLFDFEIATKNESTADTIS
jgi:hypothetical protein